MGFMKMLDLRGLALTWRGGKIDAAATNGVNRRVRWNTDLWDERV